MLTNRVLSARLCAMLFILFYSSVTFGGPAKVEVCHIPPENPDNYHTIKISEKALAKHLAHFDLVGSCNELCDTLCDDGNACTIDHDDNCEQNGCYAVTEPVDCSDGNLCTDDLCDPASGCSNPDADLCLPPADNLCITSTCNPLDASCEETTQSCNEGEECNPANGLCEVIADPDACPCFSAGDLEALGAPQDCTSDTTATNDTAFYLNGFIACSGDACGENNPRSCFLGNFSGSDIVFDPISPIQNTNCRDLIVANCTP
jgi:hypothetical protein